MEEEQIDEAGSHYEKEEERRAAAVLQLFSSPRRDGVDLRNPTEDAIKLGLVLFQSTSLNSSDLDDYSRGALQLVTDLRLGQSGNTLIHVAAKNGRADLLPLLLPLLAANHETKKHKSIPLCDVPNVNGDTPLMFGAMGGFADVVECLLASGASPISANRAGMTALMCACCAAGDQPEVCRLILDKVESSAHTDAQDANGNTALHFAAKADNSQCVSVLMSRGADITKPLDSSSKECAAALQRRWNELEEAAANAQEALTLGAERKGAKRRVRQKQKKKKQKQNRQHTPRGEDQRPEDEKRPGDQEKPDGVGHEKEEETGDQRISEAAVDKDKTVDEMATRKESTVCETPEEAVSEAAQGCHLVLEKEVDLQPDPTLRRPAKWAEKQTPQVNTQQKPQPTIAAAHDQRTKAQPSQSTTSSGGALRYADAVACKRPPPGMPAGQTAASKPTAAQSRSYAATAQRREGGNSTVERRAKPTTPQPQKKKEKEPEHDMELAVAQLKRMCEHERKGKEELALSLEILRKEKCLAEIEKQLLANERNQLIERERAMERKMRESHPQAESLALTYAHLLDRGYEELSMEQISALQQVHSDALAGLRVAMERLMVRQEHVLLEEKNALERELATLRAKGTKGP